jgi:hypothetical protein
MAKDKVAGDRRGKGAVKARPQTKSRIRGTSTKRDGKSGKLLEVMRGPFPFEGVGKVSGKELSESSVRFSRAMKRLAKR